MYKTHNLSRIHADWACLVSQSYRLDEPEFRSEALAYARRIMAQARSYVLKIIDDLQKAEYRWVDVNSVYSAPTDGTQGWLDELWQSGIFLPISFQAWLLEVGSVNLTGTLPAWPKSGYFFENGNKDQDIVYTDPLVVELSEDYLSYLHGEWVEEKAGPFMVDIAPDHMHKANISGGLPYMIAADYPRVDSILYNERHCTTFTAYVRTAIYWRGFPGLDYVVSDKAAGFNWPPDYAAAV